MVEESGEGWSLDDNMNATSQVGGSPEKCRVVADPRRLIDGWAKGAEVNLAKRRSGMAKRTGT